MPDIEKPTGERIAKLLARAGIASRREIERMIAEGRIALNGVTLDTPATILPNLKGVTVDGDPVQEAERTRLFLFHKPSGLITAERDMAGRPTIYAALRNALPEGTPRLMPVGRLDLNTEGLLLMTNDGELKRLLELPSSGVPRTYRARTFGDITQAMLDELIEGVEIDGIRYGRIDANLERSAGHNKWIELTLSEGKNREVRRVLEYFGLSVSRLIRTSYGPLELLDLPRGAAIELRREDLDKFLHGMKTRASGSSRRTDAAPAKAEPAGASRPAGGASARPGRPQADPRRARRADDRRADDRRDGRRDDRRDNRSDNRYGPRSGERTGGRPDARGRSAHASDRQERRPGAFSDPRPEGYRSASKPRRDDREGSGHAPWSDRFGDQRGGNRDNRPNDRRSDNGRDGCSFGGGRTDAPRGEPRRYDDQRRSGPPRGSDRSEHPFGDRRPEGRANTRLDYRSDNRGGGRRDDSRSNSGARGYSRPDDQARSAPRNERSRGEFSRGNYSREDSPRANGPRGDGPNRGGPNRGGPSGGRGRPSSPYNAAPRGPRGGKR